MITSSCILLNLPENFVRFSVALGLPFAQSAVFPPSLTVLAKALYFAQVSNRTLNFS